MTFATSPIKLFEAISGPSGVITHVVLRIPSDGKLDANPVGIDQGRWNIAQILDLPLSLVFRLCAADIEMLGYEWEALMQRWNLAQVRIAAQAAMLGGVGCSHPTRDGER